MISKAMPEPCFAEEWINIKNFQISCIFKVPGRKDLYIACADRWVPDHMELPYGIYGEMYSRMFEGGEKALSKWVEEKGLSKELVNLIFGDASRNTSIADYVWLSLRFEVPSEEHSLGMVYIDWLDEWKIEDYEQEEKK